MTAQLDTTPGLGGLTRPRRDGKVSGLCAAIATRHGVDVWLVRGLVALGMLSGGVGVPLYLWGWLLTPSDDDAAPITRLAPGFPRWPLPARVGAVIVSSLIVVSVIGWAAPFTIWPAIVVGAVWWLAVRRSRRGRRRSAGVGAMTRESDATPTTPFDESVATWLARLEEVSRLGTAPGVTSVASYRDPIAALVADHTPDAASEPPAGARPIRTTRVFDLGVLAMAGAAGWAVFRYAPRAWDAPLAALGAALLVLGLGVVVRSLALRGRRHGGFVTVAGVVCAAALVVQAGLAPSPSHEVALTYGPGTALPESVDALGVSQTIDLRQAPIDAEHTIRVNAVASKVVVLLPPGGASLEVHFVASHVALPSGDRAGVGELSEPDADSRLRVNVDAVMSEVEVRDG